jgi:putative membrane protein insertion efficiency factor
MMTPTTTPVKKAPVKTWRQAPLQRVLRLLLRGYQLGISPWLGPRCRFYPSCSDYALEAIDCHGAAKGTLLAVKRLLKCHPWHAGGVDPVPPKKGQSSTTTTCTCKHF